MNEIEIKRTWNYFLTLEDDLSYTSRFIEPRDQVNTYSFEFAKLLILSCTEAETLFKAICYSVNGTDAGCMGQYKEIILGRFPKIVQCEVDIPCLQESIHPFADWDKTKLSWWDAYSEVKHNIGINLSQATYMNACMALSAVYILILYYSELTGIGVNRLQSKYITSVYCDDYIVDSIAKKLPDFE